MKPAIIVSTYPNKRLASKIAKQLVIEKIAACVNISEIQSIYSWEGKIEDTKEFLALFKTSQKNKAKLKVRIKETHPYDVPEIAEISIDSINEPYLKWLVKSTI
jgi:periplasmic divalent cation tolerance protein